MKILVTGSEGYIGSLLIPVLRGRGHEVIGLDAGFYRAGRLYDGTESALKTIYKDARRICAEDLRGIAAVVHLAELSNDPVGQLSPRITHEINHQGSVRLATLARAAGVRRFIYASSCSVYGVATDECVSEDSPVNPQTAYAVCKTLVERDVKALADEQFSPTFLRNATAFGASPAMRFDLVLNNLSGLAWTAQEIRVMSDGTPWRPLVHVKDICRAIVCALEAPREAVHNEVFNVGDTGLNYTVKEIAEIVAETFPGCKVSFGDNGADRRSYRVSFEKINSRLPGFRCEWDARRGAEELREVFARVGLSPETFRFRGYTRLKQIEHLLRTRQIDENFFWREARVKGCGDDRVRG
ncbi:MAG TPA: SDR family oxidoreductase [Blastocatellia bacterium]|nr:SDR family oxidoreductase [Blastocatellia bacterium]